MKKLIVIVSLALLFGVACDSYNTERGRGDAPVGTVNDTPATVIQMPDQFGNVAFKCHELNGIYVNTREASTPVIVPNDPNCQA